MRKTIIYILIVLLSFYVVTGANICGSQPVIGRNCTMLTKSLECDIYNYTIFNTTGAKVEQGDLTNLNESIYSFDWNHNNGEYIIMLCDGTTREVRVLEDEGMTVVFLIILIGIPFLLLYFANSLYNQSRDFDGNYWNYFLRAISYIFFIAFMPLLSASVVKMSLYTQYYNTAVILNKFILGFVIVLGSFIFLYLFWFAFQRFNFLKESERRNY